MSVSPVKEYPPQEPAYLEQIERILYDTTISALTEIFKVSQDKQSRHENLHDASAPNMDLFQDVDALTKVALGITCWQLGRTSVIKTESGRLGYVPECDIQKGDQVWMVLGCETPIVLRPRPNGRYWHV